MIVPASQNIVIDGLVVCHKNIFDRESGVKRRQFIKITAAVPLVGTIQGRKIEKSEIDQHIADLIALLAAGRGGEWSAVFDDKQDFILFAKKKVVS